MHDSSTLLEELIKRNPELNVDFPVSTNLYPLDDPYNSVFAEV